MLSLLALSTHLALGFHAASLELPTQPTEEAARAQAAQAAARFQLVLDERTRSEPEVTGPGVQVYGPPKGPFHVSVWAGHPRDVEGALRVLGNPPGLQRVALDVREAPEPDVVPGWALVVWRDRDFLGAEAHALALADARKLYYSRRGHVFDSEKGFVLPPDDEDEQWRGDHYPRRPGEHHGATFLSVEPASQLGGPADEYWVVAAMGSAGSSLPAWSPPPPSGTRIDFWLYVGCLH